MWHAAITLHKPAHNFIHEPLCHVFKWHAQGEYNKKQGHATKRGACVAKTLKNHLPRLSLQAVFDIATLQPPELTFMLLSLPFSFIKCERKSHGPIDASITVTIVVKLKLNIINWFYFRVSMVAIL